MNYIDLFTQKEKSILCEIITGRDFKELFKRNEKEFSKIRKGFRAKSLTEQQALSIAISNVDKPFIAMWVNVKVDIWLKEIQENIDKLEENGSAHDIALAETMYKTWKRLRSAIHDCKCACTDARISSSNVCRRV